jgi:hypothetical protein
MSSSAIYRAAALLFILLFAPLASAQVIFKCVGKDGTELYQNSSCPAGSESQVVLRMDKARTLSVPSAQANSPAAQDEPRVETLPAPTATGETAAPPLEPRIDTPSLPDPLVAQSEPRLGMTQTEVKAIWGEPTEITMEEVVQGRIDTWSYGSRSLQFDAGRLSAIQR